MVVESDDRRFPLPSPVRTVRPVSAPLIFLFLSNRLLVYNMVGSN